MCSGQALMEQMESLLRETNLEIQSSRTPFYMLAKQAIHDIGQEFLAINDHCTNLSSMKCLNDIVSSEIVFQTEFEKKIGKVKEYVEIDDQVKQMDEKHDSIQDKATTKVRRAC